MQKGGVHVSFKEFFREQMGNYQCRGMYRGLRPTFAHNFGGTGDTLTGIVSVLIETGMGISEAASIAARANRLAGYYAEPTPATQVMEIIRQIPRAIDEIL